MIGFVCAIADPVEVTSPRKLNARGRIKLAPEVAAAHGIKAGSRGKSVGSAAQKGRKTFASVAIKPAPRPRIAIRNRGESTTSSEGQRGCPRHLHPVPYKYAVVEEVVMGRAEQSMKQSNSKKRRHQTGRATWFDFKGNAAAVASTYAHFVPVYNFLVSPELRDYYKEVVEELGNVASTEVLSDRNNLISSVSALIAMAKDMADFGDDCASAITLDKWRNSFVLPILLRSNKGLEERRAGRKLVLPGEIMRPKEELKVEAQKLKEQQKEQVRITAEASRIAAEVTATSKKLQLKQK
ncbi:hypothetical protein C5167_036503 [Papaver somniferum]|uniref:Uncharacterized protein n=1 Tax=Papaver somniferum TaxID=3469 RepID=A0A4Y7I654_PAPSO|nr:hypothetical protein C5167_036503 [Papaver somniferum]